MTNLFLHTILEILMVGLLIVISVIDIKKMIIPNCLVLCCLIVGGFIWIFCRGFNLVDGALGFLTISVPLLIISLLTNGGLGGGDIKLFAALGVALGVKLVLISGIIAFIVAGLAVGILGGVLKRANFKKHIPFAPFICIGYVMALLFGDQMLIWYLTI